MIEMVRDTYTDKKGIREQAYSYDVNNRNDILILEEISKLIDRLQPTCFNCANFFHDGCLGGYQTSMCKIHGCLEDCLNPHYDCDGSKCEDYRRKEI